MVTYVSLRVGVCRGMLELARRPKYLRFVLQGTDWTTLDALDQLEDEPRPGEHVIAAVWTKATVLHIHGTRNGRRFGEWRQVVTYEPAPDQPPPDVLRDGARWRSWCLSREGCDGGTVSTAG